MTVYRWKQNELFSSELNRLTTNYVKEFSEKLNYSAMTAVDTLNEIMNDLREPSMHRGKVALGLLRSLPHIQSALAKIPCSASLPPTKGSSAGSEAEYEIGPDGTVII
jgi:hypothetical protein